MAGLEVEWREGLPRIGRFRDALAGPGCVLVDRQGRLVLGASGEVPIFLTRDMARDLAAVLLRFAETGEIGPEAALGGESAGAKGGET